MRNKVIALALAAVLLGRAEAAPAPRPGDVFEITTDWESETHGNQLISTRGSTSDRDAYVERIVEVRPEGVVLDFDVPPETTPEERAQGWQFPVRVLKPASGPLRLLDARGMEARVDAWLKRWKLPRTACGKTVFTWNSFQIQCDPQAMLPWLVGLDLPEDLRAGTAFADPDARAPVPLKQQFADKLVAELAVDPEVVRRQRAQTDVGVAELMHKPVTIEAALKTHAVETITGTITVTFEIAPSGDARRTRVRAIETAWPDGRVDVETVTDTLTRKPFRATARSSGA